MCLAVPGKIAAIAGEGIERRAKVDFGGVLKDANLACLPEAKEGDYILVHVGMGLSVVDPEEAQKIFGCLKEIKDSYDSEIRGH